MALRLSGRSTSLRPATEADVTLLVAWHLDPEVSRYWDDRTFTPDEMRARLRRENVQSWIVEAGDEPVGFLQAWTHAEEPERGGLDGFLVAEARGRGLMPDAARALATALHEAGGLEVTVDPYAWNDRAVRGWEKAGFVEVSRHDADADHRDPWVLMRFVPTSTRR